MLFPELSLSSTSWCLNFQLLLTRAVQFDGGKAELFSDIRVLDLQRFINLKRIYCVVTGWVRDNHSYKSGSCQSFNAPEPTESTGKNISAARDSKGWWN